MGDRISDSMSYRFGEDSVAMLIHEMKKHPELHRISPRLIVRPSVDLSKELRTSWIEVMTNLKKSYLNLTERIAWTTWRVLFLHFGTKNAAKKWKKQLSFLEGCQRPKISRARREVDECDERGRKPEKVQTPQTSPQPQEEAASAVGEEANGMSGLVGQFQPSWVEKTPVNGASLPSTSNLLIQRVIHNTNEVNRLLPRRQSVISSSHQIDRDLPSAAAVNLQSPIVENADIHDLSLPLLLRTQELQRLINVPGLSTIEQRVEMQRLVRTILDSPILQFQEILSYRTVPGLRTNL